MVSLNTLTGGHLQGSNPFCSWGVAFYAMKTDPSSHTYSAGLCGRRMFAVSGLYTGIDTSYLVL